MNYQAFTNDSLTMMYEGSYVAPWLYRVCIRLGGKPRACSDDAKAHP
jgi:hypothetical protein